MQPQSAPRVASELDRLLIEFEGQIYGTFARFSVPPQDAEDILQDGLLALVTKAASIHNPGPWLLAALRHGCVSYWRRRRRWLYEQIDEALKDTPVEGSEQSQDMQGWRCDLRDAISQLPKRCKELLHLRYRLGCETGEMADAMGYREGSVRKAEMRCLSALTGTITRTRGWAEP
jgi:RNA polymerase sigma-70 factor (ECF subfamily)